MGFRRPGAAPALPATPATVGALSL